MLVGLHLNHDILRETRQARVNPKESNQDLGRREREGSTKYKISYKFWRKVWEAASVFQRSLFGRDNILALSLQSYQDTGLHPEECDLDVEGFGNHVTKEK